MSNCTIYDSTVGDFLESCPKLKRLQLNWLKFKPLKVAASLFDRTYPLLDHVDYNEDDMVDLMLLFQRNSNIKRLRIPYNLLRAIPSDTPAIRLDYLILKNRGEVDANELYNRLKLLHDIGIFKKLCLQFDYINLKFFLQIMISISGIEMLGVCNRFSSAMCQGLTQLKELELQRVKILDAETMAKNLINLGRLWFQSTFDVLSAVIRHSKRLKFVIFRYRSGVFKERHNDKKFVLNLADLNSERALSGVEGTVHIGLHEKLFLATKWKATNVNCGTLVEITREGKIMQHFTGFYT